MDDSGIPNPGNQIQTSPCTCNGNEHQFPNRQSETMRPSEHIRQDAPCVTTTGRCCAAIIRRRRYAPQPPQHSTITMMITVLQYKHETTQETAVRETCRQITYPLRFRRFSREFWLLSVRTGSFVQVRNLFPQRHSR